MFSCSLSVLPQSQVGRYRRSAPIFRPRIPTPSGLMSSSHFICNSYTYVYYNGHDLNKKVHPLAPRRGLGADIDHSRNITTPQALRRSSHSPPR